MGFVYLILSPSGGKMLVRYVLQEYASVAVMHVGQYKGSLQDGFILKDIRIIGLAYLPNALLRIQEIDVRLSLTDLSHLDLDIFNARLLIPGSDPVVFTGRVYGGQINGEIYARSVDIHEASRFWIGEDVRKSLQGYISNVDFSVQGPLSSPRIIGSFLAESIRFQSIRLTDAFSKADLTFLPLKDKVQMTGEVILNSGLVNVRKTDLELSKSKIDFKGDVFDPTLDIGLDAKVEDMEFHLAIKGDLTQPQLTVSSDPPMAPQDALRILFTGNAWASSTSPFNGVTSSELAQNFLNYSLADMNENQQLGLKTKLTDNLKIGAEMDQMPVSPGETNVYYSRKINGEMDLSDHMSLNISHEVMPQDSYPSTGYEDAQSQAETQIYVQYKKRF